MVTCLPKKEKKNNYAIVKGTLINWAPVTNGSVVAQTPERGRQAYTLHYASPRALRKN